MFRLVLLLAGCLSLAFAPAPFPRPIKRDLNKEDLKLLQGTWKEPGGFVWMISGSRLIFMVGGKTISEWQITLNARKKPKQFDLHWRAGSGQGVSPLGIYRLQGDILTVCFDDDTRPADFKRFTPEVSLRTYTRMKPGATNRPGNKPWLRDDSSRRKSRRATPNRIFVPAPIIGDESAHRQQGRPLTSSRSRDGP
jgi:uncharacterized protein (TIGR03067 family)